MGFRRPEANENRFESTDFDGMGRGRTRVDALAHDPRLIRVPGPTIHESPTACPDAGDDVRGGARSEHHRQRAAAGSSSEAHAHFEEPRASSPNARHDQRTSGQTEPEGRRTA